MHISKKAFVSTILASGLLFGAAGVYAADGISLVKAYLNSTIKFTVDGAYGLLKMLVETKSPLWSTTDLPIFPPKPSVKR